MNHDWNVLSAWPCLEIDVQAKRREIVHDITKAHAIYNILLHALQLPTSSTSLALSNALNLFREVEATSNGFDKVCCAAVSNFVEFLSAAFSRFCGETDQLCATAALEIVAQLRATLLAPERVWLSTGMLSPDWLADVTTFILTASAVLQIMVSMAHKLSPLSKKKKSKKAQRKTQAEVDPFQQDSRELSSLILELVAFWSDLRSLLTRVSGESPLEALQSAESRTKTEVLANPRSIVFQSITKSQTASAERLLAIVSAKLSPLTALRVDSS